jgi:hypothetical protein
VFFSAVAKQRAILSHPLRMGTRSSEKYEKHSPPLISIPS